MRAALVVEDGGSPYALAAVRSLGRAGWRVGVASPHPNPKVMASRWTDRWHPSRLPEVDLPGFLQDVRSAVADGGYDIVFGADDIEVLALSSGRAGLGAVFPHASNEAVVRSVDKLTLTQAARAVGVPVPHTVAATPEAVAAVSGPVAVKARLHWTPGGVAMGDRHLLIGLCDTATHAREQVALVRARGGEAVLQEVLDGEQLALSLVVDSTGAPLAISQQKAVMASLSRTSTRAETVPVDDELLAGAVRLLRELGWVGLANLQYLRGADGTPRLIDLNGRFYGSLALAVAAGADLPAVWAAMAQGEPAGPVQRARPGVRFHALHTDLLRARVQRRGGLLRDVVGTLGYAAGAAHSTWSREDPRPALAMTRRLVLDGVRRRAGGPGV